MNKIITILLSLLLFIPFLTTAQQISVSSFDRRDNDMDARVNYPVKDQNGDVCALLKIETTQTGFVFEGGSLGIMKTEKKTGEYWVYIPWGSKRITIKHQQLGILRDYMFPVSIEKSTVYLMKLTTGTVTTIVEEAEILTEWVVISSTPEGASVYIDDKSVGKTPFSGEYIMGQHKYRIDLEMYHNDAGVFTLDANNGKQKIQVNLKPNFGSIYISSTPESGAEVILDGKPTGKSTPCTLNEILSGEHRITIKREMYYDAWQDITVEDNKTANANLTMKPAFGELDITTSPSADIYINGSKVGSGSHKERKTSGFYTVEARKVQHSSDSKKVEVTDGQTIKVDLAPLPQYGTLKIMSTPPEADIYIDGKHKGTTPITLRELLVGNYSLELKKNSYATVSKTITIRNKQTTDVNETLASGKQITISSTPSGAVLKIDDKQVGTTPYNDMLGFGSHSIKITNNTKIVSEIINITQNGKTSWSFNVSETKDYTETASNLDLDMVFIKGGSFTMGCTSEQASDCESDEKPSHKVTLSDYYIGKYEVTQAQWRAVMGSNPSNFKGNNLPVEKVSWNDIQTFITKLNQQTGKTYRLPTEAEWEFAARGGNSSRGYKYSGSNNIGSVAWYDVNSNSKTHPVGQKTDNELGIYDMSGNVWEWCSDLYGDYSSSNQTNPKGASSGSYRVLRGGSWFGSASYCRVSYRYGSNPENRRDYDGFRLVCSSD